MAITTAVYRDLPPPPTVGPVDVGGVQTRETSPAMRGWNVSLLAGRSPFWAEICRDVSGDAVSPYNAALQTLLANDSTHKLRTTWYGQTYGMSYQVVPGTAPLKPITFVSYPTSFDPTGLPIAPDSFFESWPSPVGGSGIAATRGWNIITGVGFTTAARKPVAGHTYRLAPTTDYGNWQEPAVTVASVDSDTQLTLTAPYAGNSISGPYVRLYGPFDLPFDGSLAGDHHCIAIARNESTLLPQTLYEAYFNKDITSNAGSQDGGATYRVTSAGTWDLQDGTQHPDGEGPSTAAGLPVWPFMVTYDEVASGEIKHALRLIVGTAMKGGGYVWPAPISNRYPDFSFLNGKLPLGARVRLNAAWVAANVGSFTNPVKVIVQALAKYGAINGDWTSPGYSFWIEGANDARWTAIDIAQIQSIPLSAFELIDTVRPQYALEGPPTLQVGVPATFTVRYLHDAQQVAYDYRTRVQVKLNGVSQPVYYNGVYSAPQYIPINKANGGVNSATYTPTGPGTYVVDAQGSYNSVCYWLMPQAITYTI